MLGGLSKWAKQGGVMGLWYMAYMRILSGHAKSTDHPSMDSRAIFGMYMGFHIGIISWLLRRSLYKIHVPLAYQIIMTVAHV